MDRVCGRSNNHFNTLSDHREEIRFTQIRIDSEVLAFELFRGRLSKLPDELKSFLTLLDDPVVFAEVGGLRHCHPYEARSHTRSRQ
jgi:hypothetical protein